MKNSDWRRNLLRRPPRPAAGNGRVRRMIRRLLRLYGRVSTSEAISHAYARRLLLRRERRRNGFNVACRRAFEQEGARKLYRAASVGRPWVWEMPRTSAAIQRRPGELQTRS